MYVVIRPWVDLQDWKIVDGITSYHRYKPGDTYPREGLNPTPERIHALSTSDNLQHVPLIAIPESPETEAAKEEPEMAQKEPAKSPAKEKPKRTAGKKPAVKKTTARKKE